MPHGLSPRRVPDRQVNTRLESWKEIATYLGREVRTVQRWEKTDGLPVHRLYHSKRGSVYALTAEIDRWWESRSDTLVVAETPPAPRRLAGWTVPAIAAVLVAAIATAVLLRSGLGSRVARLTYETNLPGDE